MVKVIVMAPKAPKRSLESSLKYFVISSSIGSKDFRRLDDRLDVEKVISSYSKEVSRYYSNLERIFDITNTVLELKPNNSILKKHFCSIHFNFS